MLLLSWSLRSFAPRFKSALRSGWFWAVVGVTVIGLALRAFHLGSGSLWYDEAFSALAAERPFEQMIDATAYDVHPPLYYTILWAHARLWPGAGRPSEAWLRLPSLFFSVLAIPLTWSFARGWSVDRRAALLAAGLMSALPFQIFYGQEARQYSLLLFMSLIAVVCFQRRWWSGMCAGLIGCMYTHNLGVLWSVVFGLIAVATDRWNWRRLLWVGFCAGMAYLPWVFRLTGQVSQVGQVGYWLPQVTPGGFLYPFHALMWGERTGTAGLLPGMLLSATMLIMSISASTRRQHSMSVIAILLGVPALVATASLAWRPVYLVRGLITITPALYTLIAMSLVERWASKKRVIAAITLITMSVSLVGYYNPRLQKWAHREWAAIIAGGWHTGDVVLCAGKCLPFMWYLPDVTIYTMPTPDDDRLHCNLSSQTIQALGIREIQPEQITGYKRLWLVWTDDPSTTPSLVSTKQQLEARWPRLFSHQFVESKLVDGYIMLFDMETTWTDWTR